VPGGDDWAGSVIVEAVFRKLELPHVVLALPGTMSWTSRDLSDDAEAEDEAAVPNAAVEVRLLLLSGTLMRRAFMLVRLGVVAGGGPGGA